MHRIEAITDRIKAAAAADNALNKYKEIHDECVETMFLKLFSDASPSNMTKMKFMIEDVSKIQQLSIILRLMEKHLGAEEGTAERNFAIYSKAVLIDSIDHSLDFWIKLIIILGDPYKHREIIQNLDNILKIKNIYDRFTGFINGYLMAMSQLDENTFFIEPQLIPPEYDEEMFKSISMHHMILVIHHLLNHKQLGAKFNQKIYIEMELSPSFITFLKRSLRNLNL